MIWGVLNYGQICNHRPDKDFLAKWPKDTVDITTLVAFMEEETAQEQEDLELARSEETAIKETQAEEVINKGNPK
ncbi:hypothetical protein FRB94_013370 [Tulasnella sp. JGI-2019a]|nr:hypothetical protein FRB93_007977 [Tulasnella sp. JGI-2019a]KAG8990420.1 hypothetical protein FRB94_013370 [Tulasnella sp. JGI-2019a]